VAVATAAVAAANHGQELPGAAERPAMAPLQVRSWRWQADAYGDVLLPTSDMILGIGTMKADRVLLQHCATANGLPPGPAILAGFLQGSIPFAHLDYQGLGA